MNRGSFGSFYEKRTGWLWLALIAFGLLDGYSFVRLAPFAWNLLSSLESAFEIDGIPYWMTLQNIGSILLTASLLPTCIGFIAAQRWAFIIYYIQIPFRIFLGVFTFGLLQSTANGIDNLFPDRGGFTLIEMLFYIAALLETVRLLMTIAAHRRLKINGALANPKWSSKLWGSVAGLFAIGIACIGFLFLSGRMISSPAEALHQGNFHAFLKLLKDKPELINSKDSRGYTLLQQLGESPYSKKHSKILKALINMGADINQPGRNDSYPVHHFTENPEQLAILLELGASAKVKDAVGETPLHKAIDTAQEKSVELLLKYSADLNAANNHGETPLHLASRRGNEKLVRFLLSEGAWVNIQDNNGDTPLHEAFSEFNSFYTPTAEDFFARENVVRALLLAGADPSIKNNKYLTAIEVAELFSKKYGRTQIPEIQIQK